jgi:hypothetical protein
MSNFKLKTDYTEYTVLPNIRSNIRLWTEYSVEPEYSVFVNFKFRKKRTVTIIRTFGF